MLFAIVKLLWIIAISLLVYAVVSKKSGGSTPLPSDLPAIPQNASVLRLAGNEFSICTPFASQGTNNGISGNTFYVLAYPGDNAFGKKSTSRAGCNYLSDVASLVNNDWVLKNEYSAENYVLYSSDYTTQQLVNFYLSGYNEDFRIVGTLSKPTAINITTNSLTIQSTKNITEGNNIVYRFWYSTNENDPFDNTKLATVQGNTVSAAITNLSPGETYYFLCTAENVANYIESSDSDGIQTDNI